MDWAEKADITPRWGWAFLRLDAINIEPLPGLNKQHNGRRLRQKSSGLRPKMHSAELNLRARRYKKAPRV